MRIVYINDEMIHHNGMVRVFVDKMNYFVDKYNYEIYLVTTDQANGKIAYPISERIICKDLGVDTYKAYRYSLFNRIFIGCFLKIILRMRLKKYINVIGPDLIITTTDYDICTVNKIKGNIPYIVESHSMASRIIYERNQWNFFHKILKCNQLKQVTKTSALVTLTNGDAKDWKGIKEAIVIPNIVHLNPYNTVSKGKNKHIIFVGRISNQKGIIDLLHIWHEVYKLHNDWILDIYGEKEECESYTLLNEYSLESENIVVHDPTNRIFEEYLRSSILILTSEYEPFGLVLPEAMSCGLPVVSFDCPYGPRDIITDGIDGFLISPKDYNEFINKICLLIENPDLRKKMGITAQLNSQRFSADNIMPKWIDLFNRMIAKDL